MELIEKGTSPFIKSVQEDTNTDIKLKKPALLNTFNNAKIDILQNSKSKSHSSLIRPEIKESWIRSLKYGLNLYDYNYGPVLGKKDFEELLNKKTLLLEAAYPLIQQIMSSGNNCLIQLSDENGVILHVERDKDGIFFDRINKEYQLTPGVVWSEKTVGTLAHTLSLVYGIPMQMYGPEHFSDTYHGLIASSAPIFDGNNNLVGSICLVNRNSIYKNAHSLSLVTSAANAIQQELNLISNQLLSNLLLESTEKSIITINKSGLIIDANINARKTLGANMQNMNGYPIEDILGKQPLIKSVLETRRPLLNAEIHIEKLNQRFHLHSAKPLDDRYGNNYGYVLILEKSASDRKKAASPSSLETKYDFDKIVGKSPTFLHSVDLAKKFSLLDGNILLHGESGTGKEMYAQAIHNLSRPNGPFIAINCAAIPQNLIESEFFGYEGGAFTGAESQGRKGKIELASGGTLFLDEIGDMPLELQPALLRVLEEKQVMRIGSNRYIPVDFKLITATNHDLLSQVKKNQFREDLYYRLETFQIHIPPLRERGQDILELAQFFVNTIAEKQNMPAPVLGEAAMFRLLQFNWPGNVRQLKSAMLYAVNSTIDGVIKPEDLPQAIREFNDGPIRNRTEENPAGFCQMDTSTDQLSIKEMEKIMIIQAIIQTGNNFSEAARVLGISKSSLYRKVKDYNLFEEIRNNS